MNPEDLTRHAIGIAFIDRVGGQALARSLSARGHPVIYSRSGPAIQDSLSASTPTTSPRR